MSKFLTAPQWYDESGKLNRSLDVNYCGTYTSAAFGMDAQADLAGTAIGAMSNAIDGGISVGILASSTGGSNSIAIGGNAKANFSGADCIAIGVQEGCVEIAEPSRRIQFFRRESSVVKTSEIGFGRDSLLDLIYPIDSIYISVSSTDPRDIFGGTWEAFATGRTLVGVDTADTDFNAAGNEGGSKTVILTTEQMPEHRHYLNRQGAGSQSGTLDVFANTVGSAYGTVSSTSTGEGLPHDNMPPYITVYMWKRTA